MESSIALMCFISSIIAVLFSHSLAKIQKKIEKRKRFLIFILKVAIMAIKFSDGDVLRAMQSFVDYECVVRGYNGKYGIRTPNMVKDKGFVELQDSKADENSSIWFEGINPYLKSCLWLYEA